MEDNGQDVLARLGERFAQANDIEKLGNVRTELQRELIEPLLAEIKTAPHEAKRLLGKQMTERRDAILAAYSSAREALEAAALAKRIGAETLRVDLPGNAMRRPHQHILNDVANEMADFFAKIGFDVVLGEDVVTDEFNFARLNIPRGHPARAMQESFYVDETNLLRTHCTSVTAKALASRAEDDVRVVSYGAVYRNDEDDATHSHQFMQMDIFWVAPGISLVNLRWLLLALCRRLFGEKSQIRMRPSFFPFTEPSYEVDVQCPFCGGTGCHICKRSGWVEILGCGMLHENVLKAAGRNPRRTAGLAAGIGIERIAMLKYQIRDIRSFYANDLGFLGGDR